MMICPRVSLVQLVVDGIKVILDRDDAKDYKRKYPHAQINSLRSNAKGRSRRNTAPSPVRIMTAKEYLSGV